MHAEQASSSRKLSDLKSQLFCAAKPIILKNKLTSWQGIPRTLDELKKCIGHVVLKFRVVQKKRRGKQGPIWEGEADHIRASVNDFLKWTIKTEHSDLVEGELFRYPKEEYWMYSGYNYMPEVFDKDSVIMKAVDWSTFGFCGLGGNESAFWIGSSGAYTPCHLDTYGCNLVAQVFGRKQWILFPPEDSNALYPTRIPYEESSIFSSVDVLNPDLSEWPLFQNSHPHVVTLEPGDVLFIPPKWWHFVQNLDTSISINTWIELDQDNETRLEEAIVKGLMSFFIPTFDISSEEVSWLNPGEELGSPEDAFHLIMTALEKTHQLSLRSSSSEGNDSVREDFPVLKKAKLEMMGRTSTVSTGEFHPVECCKFSHYLSAYCTNEAIDCRYGVNSNRVDMRSIINCFVHPDVISCITQKLRAVKIKPFV